MQVHSLDEDENAFVIALASGVEIAFACIIGGGSGSEEGGGGTDSSGNGGGATAGGGGGGAKKWTKSIIRALRRRAAATRSTGTQGMSTRRSEGSERRRGRFN